jgi:signal transduction histidine kinase
VTEVPTIPYFWVGLASLLLFLAACAVLVFALWLRRLRLIPLTAVAAGISFLVMQGAILIIYAPERDYLVSDDFLSSCLASLPLGLVFGLQIALGLLLGLCFRTLLRRERQQITPMSVKAAADSLPDGLCFYLPGGRIVLVNETMQRLCQTLTGDYLANGEVFRRRVFEDAALPLQRQIAEDGVLVLKGADGTAWAISDAQADYRGSTVTMLTATVVTELLEKSESLRRLQDQLAGLNRQLTDYYRDIAALTTQKEMLSARVRLHDEMGADLLMMQRYLLHGGGEAEQAELEARLRRNLSFLKSEHFPASRDELQMIRETAEKLKLRIVIDGTLPHSAPARHILATALHECMTNTLRHAGGDELRMVLTDTGDRLLARLTNNGTQPTTPIRESGGLKSLRSLTEQAGGTMTVTVSPVFAVCLELPKEGDHAVSGFDRG